MMKRLEGMFSYSNRMIKKTSTFVFYDALKEGMITGSRVIDKVAKQSWFNIQGNFVVMTCFMINFIVVLCQIVGVLAQFILLDGIFFPFYIIVGTHFAIDYKTHGYPGTI